MQDAEFASPREEVAAIGEKGADTELAVNNYLELKRIRIARTNAEGRSDGIENNAMVSISRLHDSGDLTARVPDIKLIDEYRKHVDTGVVIQLGRKSGIVVVKTNHKFDAHANWTWTTEDNLLSAQAENLTTRTKFVNNV